MLFAHGWVKAGFLSFSASPFVSPRASFFFFSISRSPFLTSFIFFPSSISPFYFSVFRWLCWFLCLSPKFAHVLHQMSRNRKVLSRRGQDGCSSFARAISIAVSSERQRVKSRLRKERRGDKKARVNEGGLSEYSWPLTPFFVLQETHQALEMQREKTESQPLTH